MSKEELEQKILNKCKELAKLMEKNVLTRPMNFFNLKQAINQYLEGEAAK
jgi:ribosomal protein L29